MRTERGSLWNPREREFHHPAGGARRDRAFVALGVALFVGSMGETIRLAGAMSPGMRMPGGWTMPMAWMIMPGQSWRTAAVSFMGMWNVMMVVMMLPSLVPMLRSYRRALGASGSRRVGASTALVAAGYYAVWALLGAATYPVGLAIGAAEMRSPALSRSAPVASGLLVLLVGLVQLTAWKVLQLERYRHAECCEAPSPSGRGALHDGVRLGLRCVLCCWGYILTLLVIGVMDLATMAVVAAAITIERVAPRPGLVARAAGLVVIAAGVVLIARAA